MNSNRVWGDLTPEEQEKAREKARRDVDRLAVGWSAPGELRDEYGTGYFLPRVVRVIDGNKTVGVFRLTPVPPEGLWTDSHDWSTSPPRVTRRHTVPPDSEAWADHRLEDGRRIMIEQLEPGRVTRGMGEKVTVHDDWERRRAGLKRLRVTFSRAGAFDFRDYKFTVRAGSWRGACG